MVYLVHGNGRGERIRRVAIYSRESIFLASTSSRSKGNDSISRLMSSASSSRSSASAASVRPGANPVSPADTLQDTPVRGVQPPG